MESKGTFFILIIVVAVLALTLAAAVGYIFLVQGNSANNAKANVEQNTANSKEVPKDEELESIPVYDGKQYFNLKSDAESKTIAILQVDISLKYFIAFKNDKKLIVSEKLDKNILKIRELIGNYFMEVTLDEAKQKDTKMKAKEELKKQINEMLNEGAEKQHEFVYEVILSNWLYQ